MDEEKLADQDLVSVYVQSSTEQWRGKTVREAAGRTTGMYVAAATIHAVDAGLDLRGQDVALIR